MNYEDMFLTGFSFLLGLLIGFLVFYGMGGSSIYGGCWASVQANDSLTNWVCIEVTDMSYEQALSVCKHEVGHEIFAEALETMNDSELNDLFRSVE